MLEFVFFHQDISDQFIDFLAQHELEFKRDVDGDCINVSIDEDIEDALFDEIENLYDRLLDKSRERVDRDEGEHANNYQKASLLIKLKDGESAYAHIDSDILSRLLQVISNDELNALVCAVADAVENRDDRSFCEIVREEGALPPDKNDR